MATKRNRLTDLRCAWRHATQEERRAFFAWLFDPTRPEAPEPSQVLDALERVPGLELRGDVR